MRASPARKPIGVQFDNDLWWGVKEEAARQHTSAGQLLRQVMNGYLKLNRSDILNRIREAKQRLAELKSHGAASQPQAVYALAEEVMNLVEALLPGILKMAQELLDEEKESKP
jgi:hypothetical protein